MTRLLFGSFHVSIWSYYNTFTIQIIIDNDNSRDKIIVSLNIQNEQFIFIKINDYILYSIFFNYSILQNN